MLRLSSVISDGMSTFCAEDSLRGGMPIGAEYVEYLLELQRVLEDSHSPAEAGGEGAESSALSAMGHDSR